MLQTAKKKSGDCFVKLQRISQHYRRKKHKSPYRSNEKQDAKVI